MHPEYPSQAAIIAGVVGGDAGSGGPVGARACRSRSTDLLDPKLTRQFTSIAQMADEHNDVRVWGGIHFRNSLEVGEDMGRKIAAYLVENSLKPSQ